jgi:hypothetical protein
MSMQAGTMRRAVALLLVLAGECHSLLLLLLLLLLLGGHMHTLQPLQVLYSKSAFQPYVV